MNKILLAFIPVFVFVGCATTYTANEIDVAKNAVAQCMVKEARALDDMISPADSIAIGVAAACQKEIDIYDNMRVQGAGSIYRESFYRNRHIGWQKAAVMSVLTERRERRGY